MIKLSMITVAVLFQLTQVVVSAWADSGIKEAPSTTALDPLHKTAHAQFSKRVDQYFDYYLRHNPSIATQLGIHDYDTQLENYSRDEIQSNIGFLKTFQTSLNGIDETTLSVDDSIDLRLIKNHILTTLLELETIRDWEKDPSHYGAALSNSIFVIASRSFATPEVRLRSVIAREKKIPAVFRMAKKNIKNPPRIFTEIALEDLPGAVSFFEKDVPAAFSAVHDAKLNQEFQKANGAVIRGLREYETYLKNKILPLSHGDFRLGPDAYSKKLLYDEAVDLTLEDLLKRGMENLRSNQEWLKKVALQIDPKHSTMEVLTKISKTHPTRDQILPIFKDIVMGIKKFIEEHKIVSVPSFVLPIVVETPSFERSLFFASMDTPGPFEAVAKEAFFNVTLPEPTWSQEKTEEYLEGFALPTMKSTAIHETYPGHYIQFLRIPSIVSKTRKILAASSNSEGWAHYCEQMMLDEGYDGGDLSLRLGQLQDALLRNARYIVGIQMHTGHMTYEQGIQFFINEGYQTRENAERETKRGTGDPTYLYYTLGKLQILKLREDYKAIQGKKFSLQEFHDRFLEVGPVPIRYIRKILLGEEGQSL